MSRFESERAEIVAAKKDVDKRLRPPEARGGSLALSVEAFEQRVAEQKSFKNRERDKKPTVVVIVPVKERGRDSDEPRRSGVNDIGKLLRALTWTFLIGGAVFAIAPAFEVFAAAAIGAPAVLSPLALALLITAGVVTVASFGLMLVRSNHNSKPRLSRDTRRSVVESRRESEEDRSSDW